MLPFLEYPEGRGPSQRLRAQLSEAITSGEQLARPLGSWVRLPPERAPEVGLPERLAEALILGLVTLGPALEEEVSRLSSAGQLTRALLLDAVGSAAAEATADALTLHLLGEPSCRVSPGYGDWPLERQAELFALLPDTLGVDLRPSMLMLPRKSVSFALLPGANQPLRSGCASCALLTCRMRRSG